MRSRVAPDLTWAIALFSSIPDNRDEGASCTFDILWNGGCDASLTCLASVCAPPGGEGDACELPTGLVGGLGGLGSLGFAGPCRPGLYCDGATPSVCRARPGDGAECSDPTVCGDGHPCIGLRLEGPLVPSPAERAGRCGPWGDVGVACDPAATVSGCPRSMRCDPDGGVCAAREQPAAVLGAACDPALEAPAAERCLEGACEAQTRRCALVCASGL